MVVLGNDEVSVAEGEKGPWKMEMEVRVGV